MHTLLSACVIIIQDIIDKVFSYTVHLHNSICTNSMQASIPEACGGGYSLPQISNDTLAVLMHVRTCIAAVLSTCCRAHYLILRD